MTATLAVRGGTARTITARTTSAARTATASGTSSVRTTSASEALVYSLMHSAVDC